MSKSIISLPKDGIAGLKENFTSDAMSGFIVFLLALPLSLGIAKASDFPPLMGLISAIIGGLVVSLIAGSKLTIKGPAAGLIVIIVGAVADFGGGETGWHLALGAIVIAGFIQILFGVLKLGKLVDFFPLSAVHGMLAAIGMIIILKQLPVLLDVDPAIAKGKGPFALIASIPTFFMHLDPKATIIGVVSFAIMMGWNKIKIPLFRKIPAPLVVLIIAIPAELIMDFQTTEPTYALVHLGNLLDNIKINVDFSGVHHTAIFIKYVIMFALVGTLESLLTVKAIDMMDAYKRKSNANKDLIAVGIGNIIAGILGGLPMISEVARSSANIANGGKTRWANFFHGIFILLFMIFAVSFSDYIPNAALAAMLIGVGYKLAHPRSFGHIAKIGTEQMAIFIVTIFVTLSTDILIGILAGIVLKLMIHLYHGSPIKHLFNAKTVIENNTIKVKGCAVFSNFIGIKKAIDTFKRTDNVIFDVSTCKIVDHTVIENLHHIKEDFEDEGGSFTIYGLEEFTPLSKSNHKFSALRK